MSKTYRKPYQDKRFFPKENYLSAEEAKKLKNWLILGHIGNTIDSKESFQRNKEIISLLKKHPYETKKILNNNIKVVDKKTVIFALACFTFSGKDGKHVINDLFLKYIKNLGDLYWFVSYSKELRSITASITSYINKFIHYHSFEKIQKEVLAYRDHPSEITFTYLINKCGLKARNEKEELYFKNILNFNKMNKISNIFDDYKNIQKLRPVKNIDKFYYEMLPDNVNKRFANLVVKNTNINTILNHMDYFDEVESVNYINKINEENTNKYIASKAYPYCDTAIQEVIKNKLKDKQLKKKICNVIDYDLAGVDNHGMSAKNLPFVFSEQFENHYDLLFETHEKFREFKTDINDILQDTYIPLLKFRDNTTIYFDNFIGYLLENEIKVDSFIIWTYGKEFTLKKRPEILDVYETYCDRKIKVVAVNFNEQSIVRNFDNVYYINGFDFYRTEETIKRIIYSDV